MGVKCLKVINQGPHADNNCPRTKLGYDKGETTKNACGPHHVQVQSKHSFSPYGLPPNYTLPTIVYASNENINNSATVFI